MQRVGQFGRGYTTIKTVAGALTYAKLNTIWIHDCRLSVEETSNNLL